MVNLFLATMTLSMVGNLHPLPLPLNESALGDIAGPMGNPITGFVEPRNCSHGQSSLFELCNGWNFRGNPENGTARGCN